MRQCIALLSLTAGLTAAFHSLTCAAGMQTLIERNESDAGTAEFNFKSVPSPMQNDAASDARFEIVDGERDGNGSGSRALHDGKVPTEEDQPSANFFFRPGSDGGRILVDLGRRVDISRIGTYSWHPGNRAPQLYKLYAATNEGAGLNLRPRRPTGPVSCGWSLLAEVDTRRQTGGSGGQHGVSITNSDGVLGSFRFLLFDISPTTAADYFAQTFFSEIDVVDARATDAPSYVAAPTPGEGIYTVQSADGVYTFTIDTSETPDLRDWVRKEIMPITTNWYPKIVEMLPSEGFQAPRKVQIRFAADMEGVAHTVGSRVTCAANWFRRNLEGEARGAVFHELVHVVQQYGQARRFNPDPKPSPGWLVEGFADYIRWYHFEPEAKGAEISPRAAARARHDGSYRPSANFLNWIIKKYDSALAGKLNTAMREGRYTEELWKTATGKSLSELGAEWKESLGSE